VISELASVEGAVRVEHLVTNGTVVGPVEVGGSLEMQPRSRIVGDVGYLVIEMHQGAVIEGKLIHRGPGSAELPAAGQVS
jgi:cytoskeletal protein CcmA (bactofilin family)